MMRLWTSLTRKFNEMIPEALAISSESLMNDDIYNGFSCGIVNKDTNKQTNIRNQNILSLGKCYIWKDWSHRIRGCNFAVD